MQAAVVAVAAQHQQDPTRIAIEGYSWTAAERAALGERSYRATKARIERAFFRVRLPIVRFAKREGADAVRVNHHADDEIMPPPPPQAGGGAAAAAAILLLSDRLVMLEPAQLRLELQPVLFCRRRREKDATLEAAPFVDAWLLDASIRTLEEVVFDPRRPQGPFFVSVGGAPGAAREERWNNWPGIAAAALPALPVPVPADVAAGVERILEHIRTVLLNKMIITPASVDDNNNNEEEEEGEEQRWFLDYLAVLVKRPWAKTGVIPVFTGGQGAGKNGVFDWFRRRVLGDAIAVQLQNPQQGLFDRFGAAHLHRIFVQIDEAEGLGACESELKNLATADEIHVQLKFKARAAAPNYANVLITTNSACPARVAESERRFVFFRVSDARIGDAAHFDALHAAFADPRVARAFYDRLMARDVAGRYGDAGNLQRTRPITPYFAGIRETTGISPLKRFLSAAINAGLFVVEQQAVDANADVDEAEGGGGNIATAPSSALYERYLAFCRRAGNDDALLRGMARGRPLSRAFFGFELKQLDGVAAVRRSAFNVFVIDYRALRAHLERTREYDAAADLL